MLWIDANIIVSVQGAICPRSVPCIVAVRIGVAVAKVSDAFQAVSLTLVTFIGFASKARIGSTSVLALPFETDLVGISTITVDLAKARVLSRISSICLAKRTIGITVCFARILETGILVDTFGSTNNVRVTLANLIDVAWNRVARINASAIVRILLKGKVTFASIPRVTRGVDTDLVGDDTVNRVASTGIANAINLFQILDFPGVSVVCARESVTNTRVEQRIVRIEGVCWRISNFKNLFTNSLLRRDVHGGSGISTVSIISARDGFAKIGNVIVEETILAGARIGFGVVDTVSVKVDIGTDACILSALIERAVQIAGGE